MDTSEEKAQQNIQDGTNIKKTKLNVKEIMNKVSDYIKNGKYLVRILGAIAIVTTVGMIGFIVKTIIDTKNLNSQSENLYNLNNYDTSTISTNSYLKNEATEFKKINDLIDYNSNIQETTQKYNEYLHGIQASYDNFLKYLFLPSLNIWKDEFLGKINDDYVGEKFLEHNPYNDIDLIDKRSNFIKNVGGNNEYNDIESIEIGEINEEGDDFYIPIKVSYISNSYRSFLLLVEKLSTTSNQKSISLINELIYNIREVIKRDCTDEITEIQNEYPDFSEDKAIGYNLYQRVKGESEDSLITNEIIDKAIREIAQCGNESSEYCYYKFRNKYRNLPSLAYTIGLENNLHQKDDLRNFLQEMPQIIKIINFTYEGERETTDLTNYTTKQYVGSVEFRIYGDGFHDDEVLEIQNLLGEKCIGKTLTRDSALAQIESKITNLGNNANIDSYSTMRLMELRTLITNIGNIYDYLGNYKKVIKTFEIYRMLKEGNVCNM